MEKNNMTAVEWLESQLKSTYDSEGKLPLAYTLDLVKQAREMEKEQLNKACYDGYYQEERCDVREYYDETYGEEGSGTWGRPKETYSKEDLDILIKAVEEPPTPHQELIKAAAKYQEAILRKEAIDRIPDEGLFPNYTDEDIWVSGFIEGTRYERERHFDSTKGWKEIEEEYMTDNYPVFGGPFTGAEDTWTWLDRYYSVPIPRNPF